MYSLKKNTNQYKLFIEIFVVLSFNTFDNVHNFIDSKNFLYILSCQSKRIDSINERRTRFQLRSETQEEEEEQDEAVEEEDVETILSTVS